MKEAVWDITDKNELEEVVTSVLRDHMNGNSKGASVLALSGNLGTGKTTFVQTIARQLGVNEHVTSPTFVIMKKYSLPAGQNFDTLVHIDAYRVESPAELEVLGFDEIMSDPRSLVCIEWAEKIPDLLPPSAVSLRFDLNETNRTLTCK